MGSTMTILKSEYRELKEAARKLEELKEDARVLRALEAAGVDNWVGYDHAMELLEEDDI